MALGQWQRKEFSVFWRHYANAVDGDDWGQMCFDKLQNKLKSQVLLQMLKIS